MRQWQMYRTVSIAGALSALMTLGACSYKAPTVKAATVEGTTARASSLEAPQATPTSRSRNIIKASTLGEMPDGVNRPNCKPQAGRQHVFLIHGTLHSSMLSFKALGPRLVKEGHCVYSADYGAIDETNALKARRPVADNAQEVAMAIDRVLKQTGQSKIDVIGYSQGGLIGFYLIRDKGYASKVRHFTAISPSVRGTTSGGALRFNQAGTCPACADQFHESDFIRQFTTNAITVPGVKYTVLATRDDWIVTPFESQFVKEPGVRNILVQDKLNGKTVSHVGMMYDDAVIDLIVNAVNAPPSS